MPIAWPSALPYAAAVCFFGYLCGSIPFGVLLTGLFGGPNLRAVGSGNIGATNVLRTGRKALAAATLVGDILKGTIAVVVVANLFGRDLALWTALGAFLGHLFPVWLGFKGGKGVATYLGLLLGLSLWSALLAFCVVWLGIAVVSRYSSLAALGASAVALVVVWFRDAEHAAALFLLLTVLLWIMHRGNIVRLVGGTESRIGSKAAGSEPRPD